MLPTDSPRGFGDLTVADFVSRLGSSDPVPGGGSASAVAAALGASLVTMVASLSTGRPRFSDHEPLLGWAMETGRRLADRFLSIADEDAEAYAAFSTAMKLPRGTDDEVAARTAAMQATAHRASEVPLACVEACAELVEVAEMLAGRSNPNASSDLRVAALLAEAAARGAAANVLINLSSIGDPELEGRLLTRVEELISHIENVASQARQAVASGERRDPLEPTAEST